MKIKVIWIFPAILFSVHFIFLFLQWPGWISYDDVNLLEGYFYTGRYSTWHSIIYSIYSVLFRALGDGFAYKTLPWLLIFSGCVGSVLGCLYERDSKLVGPFTTKMIAILLLISSCLIPSVISTLLLINRDSFFAALSLLLVALLYWNQRIKVSNLWLPLFTGLILSVTSLIRKDGLIYFVAFPVIVFCLRCWNLKQLSFFVFGVISVLAITQAIELKQNLDTEGNVYKVTAFTNPLSYIILDERYKSDSPEEDKRILSLAFDYAGFMSVYDPYEIPAFHKFHKRDLTTESYKLFRDFALRKFFSYPRIFLENRFEVFWSSVWITNHTMFQDNISRDKKDFEKWKHMQIESSVTDTEPKNRLYNQLMRLLHWKVIKPFNATLLPLLILVSLLFFWRRSPISAAGSLLLLSRVPAVFLFAPAAFTKYYSGVYLGVFFLLPLWFLENQANQSESRNK